MNTGDIDIAHAKTGLDIATPPGLERILCAAPPLLPHAVATTTSHDPRTRAPQPFVGPDQSPGTGVWMFRSPLTR